MYVFNDSFLLSHSYINMETITIIQLLQIAKFDSKLKFNAE